MTSPNDSPTPAQPSNPAPADARPRAPWSLGARIAAYLVMAAVALASIWLIDQRVDIPRPPAPATIPAY